MPIVTITADGSLRPHIFRFIVILQVGFTRFCRKLEL